MVGWGEIVQLCHGSRKYLDHREASLQPGCLRKWVTPFSDRGFASEGRCGRRRGLRQDECGLRDFFGQGVGALLQNLTYQEALGVL